MIKSYDRVSLGAYVKKQAASLVLFCSLLYVMAGSLWNHTHPALQAVIDSPTVWGVWLFIHFSSFFAAKMPRLHWVFLSAQVLSLQIYLHTFFKAGSLGYVPLAPIFFLVSAIALTAFVKQNYVTMAAFWSLGWGSALTWILTSPLFTMTPKKAIYFTIGVNALFIVGFAALSYWASVKMSGTLSMMGNMKAFDERRIQSAKLQSLGELTASLAHEISTPLTAVKGYLHQVQAEQKNPTAIPEAKELIQNAYERMNFNLDRILEITRLIRNFSRPDHNRDFEVLSLKSVLQDSIGLLRASLKEKNIELKTEFPETDIEISGSFVQLSQVFVNLISNAKDAVDASDRKLIQVGYKVEVDSVKIWVEDSGPGVGEDIREDIFRPFFTTKAVGKGTGLGLSISKTILERHQGHLELENKKDRRSSRLKGSCFVCSLPLLKSDEKSRVA